VDALARLCGYLPLALGIAARHAARRPSSSLAELVDEIQNSTPLDLKVGADTDVRSVFAWSLRRLPGPAARAFRLLGVAVPTHFDGYGLAALVGVSPAVALRLIQVLTRAHLVQPVGRGRFSMHDLLRDYAVELALRDLAPEERMEAARRALDYLLTTATAAVDVQFPASRPARARRRPQPVHPTASPVLADSGAASAWLADERENLVSGCVRAARFGFPGHAVALALVLRRFLDHGHFDDALTVHTVALAAALRPDTDCDDLQRAEIHTAVGITHWRLGRLDAAGRRLQHAISVHREIDDADGAARNLALLGLVRDTQGRFAEALDLHHKGLATARAAGLPVREVAALVNIAFAHVHLREFARAVDYYQQAHAIVSGLDQRYPHAVIAAGLAIAYEGLGCYDIALAHAEQALLVNQEFDLPRGRALILDAIGSIYRHVGRLDDALDVLGEALGACRDINNRAAAAQIHNTLGETSRDAGALASAIESHEEAFTVADKIGARLQRTRALQGLGDAFAAQGDLARAHGYWSQADRAYHDMGVPVSQRLGPPT
jgi:tetratricopeptide (TPR) repeat protein